jgi:3-methyladenine DNA glycosylase/8-oxoguanine DNA glycosylase
VAIDIPLNGPGGEPINFIATINSHGVTSLAPTKPNGDLATRLITTLRLPDRSIRTVEISESEPGVARVEMLSRGKTNNTMVEAAIRQMLRLDQDLSGFYARTATDPLLDWVNFGYGRMMRCQTVFEDVIKTVLTTNCAWSATIRMNERIVTELGEIDPGYVAEAPFGRAFPTPTAMASRDEAFYRETIRAGYRAPNIVKLANRVANGEIDLEGLESTHADDLELEKKLLEIPGVGPYSAAHIMHMLGRSSKLVFDSWTRPTYAKILGVDTISDKEITERFAPYGEQAGLAYWMVVTRPWFDSHQPAE